MNLSIYLSSELNGQLRIYKNEISDKQREFQQEKQDLEKVFSAEIHTSGFGLGRESE